MEYILQKVVGTTRISMLEDFSGYNEILVNQRDQDNTTFTTPWGTLIQSKMPFGPMNVGETFQMEMDITFAEEKVNL